MGLFERAEFPWGLYTDLYELTMAQGYWLAGKAEEYAVFDWVFRDMPFGGGFVVFAGLGELLEALQSFRFDRETLAYLREVGFREEFLKELERFRFRGSVYAPGEGTVVFGGEPVVRVEGALMHLQLVESLLLNWLNFSSLIATKAARMRLVAGKEKLIVDFGMRRAQALASLTVARSSYIGGLDGTSNTLAGYLYGLKVVGTMAHSWVQSFPNELEAFRMFASLYPERAILLIDTYHTLESGIHNAIRVAKEMEEKGQRVAGVRLDSGDIIELSFKVRELLDKNGLTYMRIIASNKIDEYFIEESIRRRSPIDGYGVGTRLAVAEGSPSLDGVYKLVQVRSRPVLKTSDDPEKVTLPGRKQIWRYVDAQGRFLKDVVTMVDQQPPPVSGARAYPLLECVMLEGEILYREGLEKMRARREEQVSALPEGLRSLTPEEKYPVEVSAELLNLQKELISQIKQQWWKEAAHASTRR